ncbi:MAG: hypothetical protein HZB55_13405 [Deltaproteobacteria bacterium]|nr:hypothetical protein [Deltaproteobacteria bacterium]
MIPFSHTLLASLAVVTLLGGCSREEPAPPAAAAANALTMTQGEDLSKKALEILNAKCTVCHTAERFSSKAFTPEEWNAVVDRMVTKGAKLSGNELDVIRHWRKEP